jgi:hypothetical protein
LILSSVADPGCLSRILIFTHPGSRISDPGSRIQKQQQKTGVKIFFCQTIFCSHKFHKTEYYFIFDMLKKFGPIFQELLKFLPKKLSPRPQKYGFGIRDPRSGKNLFRIPDPGVKKAPDPGSGSATLILSQLIVTVLFRSWREPTSPRRMTRVPPSLWTISGIEPRNPLATFYDY